MGNQKQKLLMGNMMIAARFASVAGLTSMKTAMGTDVEADDGLSRERGREVRICCDCLAGRVGRDNKY